VFTCCSICVICCRVLRQVITVVVVVIIIIFFVHRPVVVTCMVCHVTTTHCAFWRSQTTRVARCGLYSVMSSELRRILWLLRHTYRKLEVKSEPINHANIAQSWMSDNIVSSRDNNKSFQLCLSVFFPRNTIYNTIQWAWAPWCLRWVGTEALGEVTLRPKSQRQLWTVRFSVLIWRWPSCYFGERI